MAVASQPILAAIRRALASERNPHHLVGLASSLGRAYAVPASFLFARSRLIDLRAAANQAPLLADDEREARAIAALVTDRTRGAWNGAEALRRIERPTLGGPVSLASAIDRWSHGAWRDAAEGCLQIADVLPANASWHPPHLAAAIRAGAEAFPDFQMQGGALVLPDAERSELARHDFQALFTLTAGADLGERAADLLYAARLASGRTPGMTGMTIRDALVHMRRVDAGHFDLASLLDMASGLVADSFLPSNREPPDLIALACALVVPIAPGVQILDPTSLSLVTDGHPRLPDEHQGEDLGRWVSFYGGRG